MSEDSYRYFVQIEANRFIHNDLGSARNHFETVVNTRTANDDRDGIAYDMMACLVFSAFDVEARANFIGWKLFNGEWDEWASIEKKINRIRNELKLSTDWSVSPLATVRKLFLLRDALAHGKPDIVEYDYEASEEPSVWDALKSDWEDEITHEFVSSACSDVREIWREHLGKAGIQAHETITSGGQSVTRLSDNN